MKSLSESSSAIKIALLCLVLALLFHIIGFSTTSWVSVRQDIHDYGFRTFGYGLWKACMKVLTMQATCSSYYVIPTWLSVVRWLECIGLIGVAISTLLTVVNVLILTNKTVKQLALIGPPISGMAIIAGCIYYAMETELWDHGEAGYSYYMCCIAGTIAVVSTIFLCQDVRATGQSSPAATASNYPPGLYPEIPTTGQSGAPAIASRYPPGPYPGLVISLPPPQQPWVVPPPGHPPQMQPPPMAV